MEDLSGKQIGRYQVRKLIAHGGMAKVYRAADTVLERDVAFKIIKEDAFSEEDRDRVRTRFLHEAKSLAKLSHPNIVSIHDFGEYNGFPYLVMELVEGPTLRSLIGAPVPARQAASILAPVADALAYIHSRGMLHRDVKPSNIIIKKNGVPVLTDFGIARPLAEDPNHTALTRAGYSIGTPDYMAPEQALCGLVDGRTDEYALGAIFYELLTGQKLYKGDNPMSVLMQHVRKPIPSVRNFAPNVSPQAETILTRALAKNPNDRYPTMNDFSADLKRLAQSGGQDIPSAPDANATISTMTNSGPSGYNTGMGAAPAYDQPPHPSMIVKQEAAAGKKKRLSSAMILIPVLALVLFFGYRLYSRNLNTSAGLLPPPPETAVPVSNEVSSEAEVSVSITPEPSPTAAAAVPDPIASVSSPMHASAIDDETPEEKYGLRLASYKVKTTEVIREDPSADSAPVRSAYATVNNGDILVSNGKTTGTEDGGGWVGVRTADGFEGWVREDMVETDREGIAFSIDDFEIEIQTDDSAELKKYRGNLNRLILPSMFQGHPLTSIGVQSFYDNKILRAIVIPEGVTSIQNSGFAFCESLEYVSLPESLVEIDPFAFNFSDLRTLTLPQGLKTIRYEAFSHNQGLTSINIPDGITEIEDSVFYQCTSLRSVTLPKNLEKIGINAFAATALNEVTLPDRLVSIETRAFWRSNLEKVTFPKNLAEIGEEAYAENKLTGVTISKYTKTETNSFDPNVTVSFFEK